MRSKSRFWLWVLGLLLLVILFRAPIFGALGSYLVHDDPPQHADLVLVLAGDSSGNRIRKAAQLVRQGYAAKVIVSGPVLYGIHECDLAIAMAEKAGFPESYFVHFEHDAHSTVEEARAASALLRSMGAKRVELVTSDFHTRRAGRVFRSTIPGVRFDVVSAPDEHFSPHSWWHNREGEKTFVIEWMKTVTSWFGA